MVVMAPEEKPGMHPAVYIVYVNQLSAGVFTDEVCAGAGSSSRMSLFYSTSG